MGVFCLQTVAKGRYSLDSLPCGSVEIRVLEKLRKKVGQGVVLLICSSGVHLYGGGSGLNTLVVVNQNSTNSCEAGNYYCERRQVPPENLLRINWPGGNLSWTSGDFQTNLLNPLLAALSGRA